MLKTLNSKLALSLLMIVIIVGVLFFKLTQMATHQYYLEVTQRLNSAIAMYVAEENTLIDQGVVDFEAMSRLAHQAMVINPAVEVYLLDAQGDIISHTFDDETLVSNRVPTAPLQQFINGSAQLPITNTDPRQADEEKIFSAFPIEDQGRLSAYVYVVLGGVLYDDLMSSVGSHYVLKMTAAAIALLLILVLAIGLLLFARLTRPLKRLTARVAAFRTMEPDLIDHEPELLDDDIDQLMHTFERMARRIQAQMQHIQGVDQARRDLITNISHDLRTPLSSMQGYLDTLLIKQGGISDDERRQCLLITRRHCVRLSRLVSELFELSKLDQHSMTPQFESFSITELLQDVSQEFQLRTRRKGIELRMDLSSANIMVVADIGLIQRVLENLIENAIRHTPQKGVVSIAIQRVDENVRLVISDTGQGIRSAEIPHIFDRYYQSTSSTDTRNGSAGLGLAIVKRILDLHQTRIFVCSQLDKGTTFTFYLKQVLNPKMAVAS